MGYVQPPPLCQYTISYRHSQMDKGGGGYRNAGRSRQRCTFKLIWSNLHPYTFGRGGVYLAPMYETLEYIRGRPVVVVLLPQHVDITTLSICPICQIMSRCGCSSSWETR
jgi:hypothetical protein